MEAGQKRMISGENNKCEECEDSIEEGSGRYSWNSAEFCTKCWDLASQGLLILKIKTGEIFLSSSLLALHAASASDTTVNSQSV